MNLWKGNHINLREIVEEDWEDVHSYASIPAVSQYQPWGPNTKEQSRVYVNQIIRDAFKNLATELAGMLIEYGFVKHHLHRIYATCDVRNVASSRVLEKNAMKKEGRLHENLRVKNRWRDSFVYAILEQDWNK
ncbi:GNAT family N-acetyltransferase [Halobacillus sp. K22]|uniref:GNAT family N-acetyltransferase n=1 Tax=Halobacillus sp. K22 TaxID=3457431 RepID=UPI003FCDA8E2